MNAETNFINRDDFEKLDIRVATIIEAKEFKEARNPAYKLTLDFGDLGQMKSSAQIKDLYTPQELIGKQIIAVINFPPKQIANMISECLILGVVNKNKNVILIEPDRTIENGLKIS